MKGKASKTVSKKAATPKRTTKSTAPVKESYYMRKKREREEAATTSIKNNGTINTRKREVVLDIKNMQMRGNKLIITY